MASIVIDPGHGGQDPGTVHGGVREKDIVLAVSLLVRDKLKKHMTVKMTRTGDVTQSVNAKAALANQSGTDYCVSIHCNSGGGKGAETWVSVYGGKSKELGAHVQAELSKVIDGSRGVKSRKDGTGGNYYGMIRMPVQPAIIVEMGFLDNAQDRAFMASTAGQEKLATAIANGALKQIGSGKASTPTKPAPAPTQPGKLTEDGYWGTSTTKALQRKLGAPYVDGKISRQYVNNKKYYPRATSGWEWTSSPGAGSQTIKLLQGKVGVSKDGVAGKKTAIALQKYLGVSADGVVGAVTVKALQRWINR